VRAVFAGISALAVCLPVGKAEEPSFKPAKFGKGELQYVEGIPLLTLEGSPEEIGAAYGELAGAAVLPLVDVPKKLLARHGAGASWPVVATVARAMLARAPENHRREIVAQAKHSGIDLDVLAVANTMIELRRLGGCSALVVSPDHSRTGGPLFGRNFDFDSFGVIDRYSLVVVCRPEGKRAFASVSFPGLSTVVSGMNDAGLCVANLDVYASNDGSKAFNGEGVPLGFSYRRILEECETVEQAAELMRSVERTTWMNLAVCDKRGGAVLEITPKSVAIRRSDDGLLPCTNHFRMPGLAQSTRCWRYDVLGKLVRDKQYGVAEVQAALHAVNQGDLTLQSMVFEPAELKLHLAIGKPPASALPMKTLELASLLRKNAAGKNPD
jgi:hypothetical protein